MDGSRFDTLTRAIAQRGTRRRLVSLLLTLPLGGVLAVADEAGPVAAERPLDRVQRRTPQRNRKHRNDKNHTQDTRKGQRHEQRNAPHVFLRGIRMTVLNPLTNPAAIDVELGYVTKSVTCCQGARAYRMQPGSTEGFATEETDAYLWVANQYFLLFGNAPIGLPELGAAINGTPGSFSARCCKPNGQQLPSSRLSVGEKKTVDFQGHLIQVTRNDDEEDYKSFNILL